MKHINPNTQSHTEPAIEGALAMYKENVSPSETYFQAILSQIPEQQKLKEGRAVRSPYRWLAITQLVTLAAIVIAVFPSYTTPGDDVKSNPYYETDKQIEAFEQQIDDEDAAHNLQDYSL
jgi:hypothetical protein